MRSVQSHYVLPQLAVSDPSFLPTLEAYTLATLGGNTVDLLLNGDQIFPAALAAIRSARTSVTYAQYYYEEGPIGLEFAEALAERCRAGVRAHILLDGFGALLIFADDLTHSRKISLKRWRNRGFVDQLMEMLSLPIRGEL